MLWHDKSPCERFDEVCMTVSVNLSLVNKDFEWLVIDKHVPDV